MENFLEFLVVSWFDPYLLFLTAAGTMAGIYVGAIPGLSVTMAASILISFTFKWDVNEALALIAGIYMGGFTADPVPRSCSISLVHQAPLRQLSKVTRWPNVAKQERLLA